MFPGILPFSRASLMLNVVALAMIIVVPVLTWSIYLVKYKRNFSLHKKLQLILGSSLLVAVTLFEVDIRINGWRDLAEPSPYYGTTLNWMLGIHLFFACSATLLWPVTIIGALRKFPNPALPNEYSPKHIRLARLAAFSMYSTAITGWTFYWMAFVAG